MKKEKETEKTMTCAIKLFFVDNTFNFILKFKIIQLSIHKY